MDSEPDARWLSYDEIADMRGIDRASAIRMVRRRKWSKQDANDGTTRVAVPGAFFRAKRTKASSPGTIAAGPPQVVRGMPPGNDNDNAPTIKALSDHVRTLSEQLALAQKGVVDRDQAIAERDRVAVEREERLQVARDQAAAERTRAAVAEAKLEETKAALVEARRPFWRRWIG
jgi:hypothetical protein